ncbi:MAG: hypothetical protein WDW38_010747 [Sanguina aurantia]
MAGVFQQFRDKFTEKLKNFAETHTQDELDKALQDLVDRATSELLLGSDWGLNMELADRINENIGVSSEKSLRAIRRTIGKPNAKVQLLALTVLDTCVKNCYPVFHTFLATSELWADLLKMATDTGVVRIDGEVRDRILVAVEDYARVLAPDEFRKAYDTLLDQGVDFPVRSPEDSAPPILTPPSSAPPRNTRPPATTPSTSNSSAQQPQPPPLHDADGPATGGLLPSSEEGARSAERAASESAAAAAAADYAAAVAVVDAAQDGGQAAQTVVSSEAYGGMSEEDRIAVAMAMAEMEAEELTSQHRARQPPSMNHGHREQQQQQPSDLQQLQERQQLLAQAATAAEFSPRPSLPEADDDGLMTGGAEGEEQRQERQRQQQQQQEEVLPGGHGPALAAAEDLLQVAWHAWGCAKQRRSTQAGTATAVPAISLLQARALRVPHMVHRRSGAVRSNAGPEPADASPLRPATQVSANSCSLLAELLAGLAAEAPGSVRDDPLVTDLTQRVMAARGRLEALVSRLMEPGASSSWAGDGSAAAAGLEGLLAAALERHMVAAEVLSRVEAILEAAGPSPAAVAAEQRRAQPGGQQPLRHSQRAPPRTPAPTPMLQPPPSASAQYGAAAAAAAAAGSSLKARFSAAASTFAATVRTGAANASQSIKNAAATASAAAHPLASPAGSGQQGEAGVHAAYPDSYFHSSPVFGVTTGHRGPQGANGEESELLNPFTLDDYEQGEEEEGEGASLLTKRSAAGGVAATQEGLYGQQQQQQQQGAPGAENTDPSKHTFGQYTSYSSRALAAATMDPPLVDPLPDAPRSTVPATATAGTDDLMFGGLQVVDLHSGANSATRWQGEQQQLQQPLRFESYSSYANQQEQLQQQEGEGGGSGVAGASPGSLAQQQQQQHSAALVEVMDRLVMNQGSGTFTPTPAGSPQQRDDGVSHTPPPTPAAGGERPSGPLDVAPSQEQQQQQSAEHLTSADNFVLDDEQEQRQHQRQQHFTEYF